MKMSKLITMGLAVIMAVSAMSINVLAAYDTTSDFGEVIATSYSRDDDGHVTLNFPMVYSPNGLSNPPSDIAGSSTKYYLFDNTYGSSQDGNVYTNCTGSFTFDFTTSCTTNTKQYADFIVGGPESHYRDSATLTVKGKSTSTNSTEKVHVTLVCTGSGDDIDVGDLEVKKNKKTSITLEDMRKDTLYYVLIKPTSSSAGHAIHASAEISPIEY